MSNSPRFYIFITILLVLIGWFIYAWITQLSQGLGATAMRTPVGAAWGIYIVNFIFFVGVAHGGMAISAAVRVLKLRQLVSVARIGEVLTVVSLAMAGLSILIDMGRPDKVFNMIIYWPERLGWSPLSWDITVIVLYFALSFAYLWLTMRADLAKSIGRFPRRGRLYKALLIGYESGEEEKIDRMTWWLSIAIVFLIVMLSGGVVAWIFGLLPARPGWFGALAGPYFLTAAIASAIGAVLIIAAILRRTYNWQSYIDPMVFRGLGATLGVITLFYLYLIHAEQLTIQYAGPHSEVLVSEMLLTGEFSLPYWGMLIVGFLLPSVWLISQSIRTKWFSVDRTVIAAVLILVAFWMKRFFIVVPSLLRPLLPFGTGTYNPSWVEWSVVAGTFALTVLLYTIFIKLFPIMELGEE